MQNEPKTSQRAEYDNTVEIKKRSFWHWMRENEQSEAGHSINLDKRIPGFASIVAVVLFLIKEYIHRENDTGHFFTDSRFTLSLQVLNIVVLLIILVRGLRISIVDPVHVTGNTPKINFSYIGILEKQFINFIKLFFTMSLMLYLVMSIQTLISDNGDQFSARKQHFEEIKAGHSEIVRGTKILQDSVDKGVKVLVPLSGSIDSLKMLASSMPVDTIIKSDPNVGMIKNLKTIRQKNKAIKNLVLRIDGRVNPYGKISDEHAHINNAIDRIYHGNNIIEYKSQISDEESTVIALSNIAKITFSNLGGLFLVYSFLVLYAKTTVGKDDDYEKSLLSLKYIFEMHTNEEDKKTISIIRVVFLALIVLTTLLITLTFCLPDYSDTTAVIFSMLSGMCNALALSLLVARFESSTFNSTFSVLVILYLYANIQLIFGFFDLPIFNSTHIVEDITLLIAFIGKCFLYLYVLWVLRTDRLKYYLYHKYANRSATKEKMEWGDFLNEMALISHPKSNYTSRRRFLHLKTVHSKSLTSKETKS